MPEQAAQQLLDGRQLERYQHLAAQTYADRNPLLHWYKACPAVCVLGSSVLPSNVSCCEGVCTAVSTLLVKDL